MTSESETDSIATEEKQEIKIEELTPRMNNLIITFKVVGKSETREVNSRRTGEVHLVADATVGDETGVVTVPLWNDSIDEIEIGKTYKLEDGFTGLFRGTLQLKIGRHSTVTEAESEIDTVNNDVDMSAENHQTFRNRHYYQPRQRSRGYGDYRPNYRSNNDRYSSRDSRRRRW